MSHSLMTPEDVSRVYEELSGNSKKFKERIEKNAMSPDRIMEMIEGNYNADNRYPELASIEEMTSAEFIELYKKMAEDVKSTPEKYEAHAREIGMTADELSSLFTMISGGVEKYPEVWASKDKAQLLHPGNLSMLASALKEDTAEALRHIKGFSDDE